MGNGKTAQSENEKRKRVAVVAHEASDTEVSALLRVFSLAAWYQSQLIPGDLLASANLSLPPAGWERRKKYTKT
jgi:hypothetical protein